MKAPNVRAASVVLLIVLLAAPSSAITYTVTVLHPVGYDESYALGGSSSSQVGFGYTGGHQHAILWNGSNSDYVDLNPTGFTSSAALDVAGTSEFGSGGGPTTGGEQHALMWNGTTDSV